MTAALPIPLALQQHLVLEGVSWEFYEHVLSEIGDRPLRVTFSDGSIEIMLPLPKHESAKEVIGALIDVLTVERNIPASRFGSTTFRREDLQKGLEPDKCYYFKNAAKVQGMVEFDPAIHPAPDLAIEIDITHRSISREPIYARLGVSELWRYDGRRLVVRQLQQDGAYITADQSASFPFLPLSEFEAFIHRMESEEQTKVMREFRDRVRIFGP